MSNVEWNNGWPPKSGYYIATWTTQPSFGVGHDIVSELWFNKPDSKKPDGEWWPARGYLGQRCSHIDRIKVVKAWMPMPEPFVGAK